MKKGLLILSLILPLLASCTETFSPSIKITPSLSNVPYTGGSVDITVMTDLPWKVELYDESDNATISKTAGIGDDVVTITLPETDSWTTSSVKVTFTSSSNSATAVKYAIITQDYKPYISVSGPGETVPKEGGLVKLVVTANEEWTASCSTAGVEVIPASAEVGNYTVNVRIPANTTGSSRKITVNFAIDGDSDSFIISQN